MSVFFIELGIGMKTPEWFANVAISSKDIFKMCPACTFNL